MDLVIISIAVGILFLMVLATYWLAQFLKLKQPQLHWIILSWVAAFASAVAFHQYGLDHFKVDDLIVIAVALGVLFLMYMMLVRSGFFGAITLVVSNLAVGVILSAGAYFVLQDDQKEEITSFLNRSIPESEVVKMDLIKTHVSTEEYKDMEESYFSENDLLPTGSVEQKKYKRHVPTYQAISKDDLSQYKGYQIRITKRDSKILKGSVVSKASNKVVIQHRHSASGGLIEAPIPFSMIEKIEVFR